MSRAFTLLETLLIIATIVFLAALIFPLSLDFFKDQQLQSATQGILQTLRRAQLKAMAVEQDSNFGVYITNTNYTLFKGNSFAIRESNFDEIFPLSSTISVQSPPKEIIFLKMEGRPTSSQIIILNSGSRSQTISINEVGRINLEL
jgi:type II secretory pathway pseudopilin PulG